MDKFLQQIVYSHDVELDTHAPDIFKVLFQYIKSHQIAIMQENVNRIGKLVSLDE